MVRRSGPVAAGAFGAAAELLQEVAGISACGRIEAEARYVLWRRWKVVRDLGLALRRGAPHGPGGFRKRAP
ncbi:MAG TPA: hypothetical protein VMU06_11455 [Stellaceae bacterium]|nr:hypothetical protein [Stellaceae bacterium]